MDRTVTAVDMAIADGRSGWATITAAEAFVGVHQRRLGIMGVSSAAVYNSFTSDHYQDLTWCARLYDQDVLRSGQNALTYDTYIFIIRPPMLWSTLL